MAIIRWNPWSLDRFLEEDWDVPTIPGLSRLAGQGLNLAETDNEIIAEAALPGIPEDKIDVTIEDGVVRIVGEMSKSEKENGNRKNYMSTLSSSYNYAFRLPQGTTAEQEPVCELSDGILTLRFAKVKKSEPKKVRITKKAKNGKEKNAAM